MQDHSTRKMAKKAFVLRIEEETMKAVEKWAADEFRSTNGHLEWLIDKGLKESGRKKKKTETTKHPTTGEEAV